MFAMTLDEVRAPSKTTIPADHGHSHHPGFSEHNEIGGHQDFTGRWTIGNIQDADRGCRDDLHRGPYLCGVCQLVTLESTMSGTYVHAGIQLGGCGGW